MSERSTVETTEIRISGGRADVPVFLARPDGDGPWPGVVIIHDALGMSNDLRRQATWIAEENYLAVAPDLLHHGGHARCLIATMRALVKGKGRAFDDLDAVRGWLADRDECNGRIGVIGFCLGGGFALMLASGHGYTAASVNYGPLPNDAETRLANACPLVGSYGARDRGQKSAPRELERILARAGVEHDIKVYPEAGHAFMNDHRDDDMPMVFRFLNWTVRGAYHEPSTRDARRRIASFFATHLPR